MSQTPLNPLEVQDRFGPHLNYAVGARLATSVEPERLVATHCCFCGQQCGINLKVRENQVLGFEPRHSLEDAVRDLAQAWKEGRITDPLANPVYSNIKTMKGLAGRVG